MKSADCSNGGDADHVWSIKENRLSFAQNIENGRLPDVARGSSSTSHRIPTTPQTDDPRPVLFTAGGGHAFFEDEVGGRVNHNRAREAAATGATTLATGCPFCLVMLEDGVKAVGNPDRPLRVRDFVELVAEAIGE